MKSKNYIEGRGIYTQLISFHFALKILANFWNPVERPSILPVAPPLVPYGKKGLCAGHAAHLTSVVSIVLSVHYPAQNNLTFHTGHWLAQPKICTVPPG